MNPDQISPSLSINITHHDGEGNPIEFPAENLDTPENPAPEPVAAAPDEAPVTTTPVAPVPEAPTAPLKPIGDLDSMAAQYEQMLTEKDAQENPKPVEKMGGATAFAVSAADNTIPTVAGYRGALAGATFGAKLPLPSTGKAIAAVVFGIAGGLGAGAITQYAQQLAVDHLLPKDWAEAYKKTKAMAQSDHKYWSMAGSAAPQLALMRPDIGTIKNAAVAAKMVVTDQNGARQFFATPQGRRAAQDLINVAFGSSTQFAIEAAQELASGKFDKTALLAAALIGAASHKETLIGKAVGGSGPKITNQFVKEEPAQPPPIPATAKEAINKVATSSPEELATQLELKFPTYDEKGQGEFGFMDGKGEPIPEGSQTPTPEAPAAPDKASPFDENGQANFDFFGELTKTPKPAEGETPAPATEATAPTEIQQDLPLEGAAQYPTIKPDSTVADVMNSGSTVRVSYQKTKGTLSLQGDTLVLTPLGKKNATPIEIGPIGDKGNRRLSEYEGLKLLGEQKAPKPEAPKSKLEQMADDYISESKGRLNMGVDPVLMGAYAVKGAYHLARGAKQFGVWAGKMIEEYGEKIRPHLADIWAKAQEIHANPQLGAKAADDMGAANPVPNTDPVAKSQLDAVVDNYINGDATALVDAANAAGVINLNTFDPRADSIKLVASVANVLEERFAAVKGDTRGMEVKAKEAGDWLKSNGMGDVLTSLLNESKVDGAKPDAKIMAYQLLLANANDRLKAAIDNRMVLGTAEADAAAEAAYAHYLKVSMAYKGVGSDAGRTLNALKQSKQWLDTVALAVNGEKPIEALNKVPLTLGQKAVGALGEMMVNSVLGYKSVGANTIGGVMRSVIDPVELTIGGLLSGNSAVSRAGAKMLLWHYQNASTAFRSALVAFKTLEPQLTPLSKIDEARGGTAKNPNQYGNSADGYRSRGFLTSETWGLDPKTNPITAPLVDAVGEVYRFSQRMMVSGDEYFKAANAFAMGNAKFYVEGWDKGLRGPDLDAYIKSNMDVLIDRNGKLYSKENVIKRVAEEVRKEGLTGDAAIQDVLLRSKSEFDSNMGEVAKSVKDFAESISFQDELPKTDMAGNPTLSNSFYQFFSKHPLFRLTSGMLFIKTPINIFRWTGQHLNGPAIMVGDGLKAATGKGFPLVERMYLQHQQDLASGDPFRVAQAKGRQAVGAALIGTGAYLAMNGMLTGAGPQNREAKKALMSTGWLPYSLKVGKTTPLGQMIQNVAGGVDGQDKDSYYIEFRRMDPIASHLQLFADFNDIMKSSHLDSDTTAKEGLTAAFSAAALSIGNLVQEKSFLTNIKQAMDLLNIGGADPATAFQRINKYVAKRAANTLIPSVISQPLTAEDSQIHEINNFVQAVAARINGAFGLYAPVQRNVIGEPIDRAIIHNAALDIINPILLSETKNDPVMAELSSLMHGWAPAQRFHSPRGDNEVWDMKDFTYTKPKGGITIVKDGIDGTKAFSKGEIVNLPKEGQDAYDRYQEVIGQVAINGVTLRQQLTRLISSKAYQSLPAQQDVLAGQQSGRVDLINRTMGVYKRLALEQVKQEYPDFAKAVKTQQVRALVSKTQDAPTAKKTLNSPMVKNLLEFGNPTK